MTTKITLVVGHPTDVAPLEESYPELLRLAGELPGLQRLESAKVWPKEDGTPAPAHRTLDLYFESYEAASRAVEDPRAGQLFGGLAGTGAAVTGLFSDVEQR